MRASIPPHASSMRKVVVVVVVVVVVQLLFLMGEARVVTEERATTTTTTTTTTTDDAEKGKKRDADFVAALPGFVRKRIHPHYSGYLDAKNGTKLHYWMATSTKIESGGQDEEVQGVTEEGKSASGEEPHVIVAECHGSCWCKRVVKCG